MEQNEAGAAQWWAGVGKADITTELHGVGMSGWAVPTHQVLDGVHSRLFARAFVFELRTGSGGQAVQSRFAWVCADLTFITVALRAEVLQRLQTQCPEGQWTQHNLMLTAQHTHSSPGGYSDSLIYNLPVPGFVPQVFETVASGITMAILQAYAACQPARLSLAVGEFAADVPVAFNRAVGPYNSNPDVTPVAPQEPAAAVDRQMTVLRIDALPTPAAPDPRPLGCISWFALHTTSVHNTHRVISSDHKGWAAEQQEARQGHGFVAAYAQLAAGDVTPNIYQLPGRKHRCGPTPDDFENLKITGQYQLGLAESLWAQAAEAPPLAPVLNSLTWHQDLSQVRVLPDFANGRTGCRTAEAAWGVTFMRGTLEGPGPPGTEVLVQLFLGLAKMRGLHDPELYGPKWLLIQAASHKLMGFGADALRGPLFGLLSKVDPYVGELVRVAREDGLGALPWIPQVLPLQVAQLGPLAMVALPGEPTTVAGRRMAHQLRAALGSLGVRHALVQGYSNGYSGYLTTNEEFQHQAYEGSHTLFGQWTLAGWQTLLHQLLGDFVRPQAQRQLDYSLLPPLTPPDIRARRVHPKFRG